MAATATVGPPRQEFPRGTRPEPNISIIDKSVQKYTSQSPLEQQNDAHRAFPDDHELKLISNWHQLGSRDNEAQQAREDRLLFVSPYSTKSHLLDLDTVSSSCQHLAKALTAMQAIRPDYATASYLTSFNWPTVIDNLRASVKQDASFNWDQDEFFYVVVFRSQIPPTTDRSHLGALDELAHQEAMESGGLLKYWFGLPDSTGRNLATCVWREIDDSRRGSTGKGHKQATRESRALYTEWKIDRLKLKIGPGPQTWDIVDWVD